MAIFHAIKANRVNSDTVDLFLCLSIFSAKSTVIEINEQIIPVDHAEFKLLLYQKSLLKRNHNRTSHIIGSSNFASSKVTTTSIWTTRTSKNRKKLLHRPWPHTDLESMMVRKTAHLNTLLETQKKPSDASWGSSMHSVIQKCPKDLT